MAILGNVCKLSGSSDQFSAKQIAIPNIQVQGANRVK